MKWHKLKKYHTGKNATGYDMLSIPLKTDDDGMVGRECPNNNCQPRYFKIAPLDLLDEFKNNDLQVSYPDELYCPYCGHQANLQKFLTQDQWDWIKSLILRDATKNIQQALSNALRPTKTSTEKKSLV